MTASPWTQRLGGGAPTLADLGEERVLAAFSPHLRLARADVGPGDDAAVLPPSAGRTVVTTDSMVLGLDWRDDWSSPQDVGRKVVAQNIADVVAMGARPSGIVVALAAEDATSIDWVVALTDGMADELERADSGALGGDLSGLPSGVVITVTALGELAPGEEPFLRSSAQPGEAVIVSDRLGRSHAGLLLLQGHRGGRVAESAAAQECVSFHRAPWPRYDAGTEARRAGVRCAMDVSDGLVRDAGRLARASGGWIDLDSAALEDMAAPLREVVGERALECVSSGGEEHCLLATCDPARVPEGWVVVGTVREADSSSLGSEGRPPSAHPAGDVTIEGRAPQVQGWNHFTS